MMGRAEGIERELALQQRVAPAHHADIATVVEALVTEGGGGGLGHVALEQRRHHHREIADRHVELAALEQRARIARGERQHPQ